MADPVHLDVFADVACPWCLIGHRRLQRALAEEEPGSVTVRWRAFQLAPDIPAEGIPRREYYERKFGANAERLWEHVSAAGASEGIRFDFLAAERTVNSRLALRVVQIAQNDGDGGPVLEALMSGYMEHGVDVSDPQAIAEHLGDRAPADLVARLEAGEGEAEVAHDLTLAAPLGINAVPAFVADASFAISGAHEPPLLRKLIAAARERGEQQPSAA